MGSFRFGCVKLLAVLLVMVFLVAPIESEIYYYPSGMSQMTRVGKKYSGIPDQFHIEAHRGNKRYKITNFPRTGRSLKTWPEDDDQGKELWFGSRLGGAIFPKISGDLDEPACVLLNNDNTRSELGYYRQQDVMESDPLQAT